MKGIILAAGRGSRMGSLTEELPKCLVKLAGKSLLEWQVGSMRNGAISEIAVVRGYKAERLLVEGAHYFYNPRWSSTNMVMSLVTASEWLRRDICIVSYSDIVYESEVINQLKNASGDIVISFDPNWLELWSARFENPLIDAETFKRGKKGELIEIGSKAKSVEEIEGQYMGLIKFTPKGWSYVEEHLKSLSESQKDRLDMTSLLRQLMQAGVRIDTVAIKGRWYEVDNENDLRLYESMGEIF